MKAAICYEFGKPLVVEDIEVNPPQAGEVKIKIAACAICHSDISYQEGIWGGTPPIVLGHEASGIVEQVGPQVGGIEAGDHVIVTLIRSCGHCYFCGQGEVQMCESFFPLSEETRLHSKDGQPILQGIKTGGFAEYVVVHESQIVRIPKTIPLDSASLLACGVITGMGAVVNTAQVPLGASVVVIGTGGVGLNSVQGAVLSGAHPIIALDLVPDKLAAAKKLGATHGINPAEKDTKQTIQALTQGRGADYVFVTVGSVKALEQGLGLLRKAGTLVVVGMPPLGAQMQVEALEFANAGQRILGSKMGKTQLQVDIPKWVELYEQGHLKLDELITARYALEEINEAIEAVNRNEALRNVIVFD